LLNFNYVLQSKSNMNQLVQVDVDNETTDNANNNPPKAQEICQEDILTEENEN
jgi:hypothetical protein